MQTNDARRRPLAPSMARRNLLKTTSGAVAATLAGGALLVPVESGSALAQDVSASSAGRQPMLITAEDINGSSAPYIIKRPGRYLLAEDVNWKTGNPNARAITIASDNVTLDLGGRTLRQIEPPKPVLENDPTKRKGYKGEVVSGNVGIWAEGRKGLVIRNGSIQDVQGVGIVTKNCHQVDLLDLNVRGCGGQGVVDTTFLYRNGGIFVMGSNNPDELLFASGIRMINCICSENTSNLDYVVTLGSLVLFCDNVQVKDSVFSHTANTSPQPSGVQFNVVGIDFVICRNVLVEDCEAHDNTSGGEPAGFFAWGENYKFLRCRANRNFTRTGNRACGFNVSTTNNLEMVECEADGNYNANPDASSDAVKDFAAAGFRIGRAIHRALIQNCRAIGNNAVGKNAPAAGFMFNSTSDMVVKGCVAIGNRNAGGGLASGYHLTATQPDGKGGFVGGARNTFIDCVADGNTVDRTPLFVQPPAPAVDAGELRGDPKKGAGFFLDGQQQAKIIGCQATNNHGKGIWMRGCGGATVERNLLATNSLYGIENEAPSSASVFAGNAARLNGKGHADNYVGLPKGTPVRTWTLGSTPDPDTLGGLVNTSVSRS